MTWATRDGSLSCVDTGASGAFLCRDDVCQEMHHKVPAVDQPPVCSEGSTRSGIWHRFIGGSGPSTADETLAG